MKLEEKKELDLKRIGKKIKYHRNKLGYTQEQLSEYAHMSKNYFCELEGGKREGGISKYFYIAQALDVSLDYLVGETAQAESAIFLNYLIEKVKNFTPTQQILLSDLIDLISDYDKIGER